MRGKETDKTGKGIEERWFVGPYMAKGRQRESRIWPIAVSREAAGSKMTGQSGNRMEEKGKRNIVEFVKGASRLSFSIPSYSKLLCEWKKRPMLTAGWLQPTRRKAFDNDRLSIARPPWAHIALGWKIGAGVFFATRLSESTTFSSLNEEETTTHRR